MRDYRFLTDDEIRVLENNSCWAEDWQRVQVAEEFSPYNFHRVIFYGDIRLGVFEKQVEVSKGFVKHSGINDATLRNVTVGDNCLIEKVGNFINNYTIGNDCYISNISTMETTEGASFGEGHLISVLNEMGDGNVVLFHDLNSQLAAFMVKYFKDKQLKDSLTRLINEEIRFTQPERGTIGNGVKIINSKEITNTVVKEDCEINGAARLSDCTILSSKDDSVYIGTGVICEKYSLPTAIWLMVRRVQPSAVRSLPHTIRARCSLVVSSHSIMQARTPTSPTMPIRWVPCTMAFLSVARRRLLVPMC